MHSPSLIRNYLFSFIHIPPLFSSFPTVDKILVSESFVCRCSCKKGIAALYFAFHTCTHFQCSQTVLGCISHCVSFASPGATRLSSVHVALCACNSDSAKSSVVCVLGTPHLPLRPTFHLTLSSGKLLYRLYLSTGFLFLSSLGLAFGRCRRSQGEVTCLSDLMGRGSSGCIPLPMARDHGPNPEASPPLPFRHTGFTAPCGYL